MVCNLKLPVGIDSFEKIREWFRDVARTAGKILEELCSAFMDKNPEKIRQIEEKDYIAKLKQDGMRNFIKYGIACFKKDCKVVIGE